MSVVHLADTRLDLSGLPRFEPGSDGWSDVLGRRAARSRSRRARRAGVLAVALLLAASLPALMQPRLPAPSTKSELATAALPIQFELARVDRALQRAYDRGASAPEVEALWQTRQQLAVALTSAATPVDHWIAL